MTQWPDRLFREQADLFAEQFEDMFAAADAEVADLLDLLADEYDCEPERSLDVACGVGRHALALADRGVAAEGLDFSESFLGRARERANERGLADRTAFRHRDMRELDELSGSYDLITVFWNSLGYYGRETDEAILTDARELLADDGVLVVEQSNRDAFVADFEEATVTEADGHLTVYRQDFDVETSRFATTLDVFDADGDGYDYVDTMEWENRLYAPPVLRELCERAGFEDVTLVGGFDGSELTLESTRVVVLAR
ncbi:putative methyltransferase type 11 [Halosimplex carlsbadense 2-9-1]|uniref:Putative methyltransferase type 11 n=1 Tax=Halosimplex carlsbadense 2-9-1 TaxID=797114 RepID=M0D4E6_9EURY|nr:class I SAM-dependent methyltransferase [Halosimplex carlsbadense]ELZ29728.1 putative methyltransferase type 11 [Halosimplex carlsbadense 2-9-1]